MRVYVASSWRNLHQPEVVIQLREAGHQVYDFKDSKGFRWSEVDEEWAGWSPEAYLNGLEHPTAERGFTRDMTALNWSQALVFVMPCGLSAGLEAGWATGSGRLTICYVPDLREPDLMVKMMDLITTDMEAVKRKLKLYEYHNMEGAKS